MNKKDKILIAEDDPMIAEIYQRVFADAKFDVTVVQTGADVITKINKDQYALVLLDIILPDMNGIEVLSQIKTSSDHDTKVFMFSNLGDRESHDEALAQGADGFIEKSKFTPKEIVQQVQRLLGYYQEAQKNARRSVSSNVGADVNSAIVSPARILMIEDQKIFTDMFGKKLMDEGHDVVVSHNGAWGMKEALAQNFDLIIMDMVMPAMTGDEMLKQLRANPKTKGLPVIVLSASATDEEIARVHELGIEEYFLKTDITPTELAQSVAGVLEKHQSNA